MRVDLLVVRGLVVLVGAALAGCGGATASEPGADGGSSSSSGGSSGGVNQRIPLNHRPSDAQCSMPPAPVNCSHPGSLDDAGCDSDNSCTAGTNGRCIGPPGGPAICGCTYDLCVHDTDCAAGKTCACHDSPYLWGDNACTQGNCRIDTDCGARGFCSPSLGVTSCGLLSGFYCHTALDQCTDDTDCFAQPGQACIYSTTAARWECQTQNLFNCPV